MTVAEAIATLASLPGYLQLTDRQGREVVALRDKANHVEVEVAHASEV